MKLKYIVLSIIFSLMLNVPVVASTKADISTFATTTFPCGHTVNNVHIRKHIEMTFKRAIDISTHGTYEKWYWYCPFCGPHMDSVIGPFINLKSTESHSYALIDNGHNANTHNYTKSCATCRYEYTLSLVCNGSPCVAPYFTSK